MGDLKFGVGQARAAWERQLHGLVSWVAVFDLDQQWMEFCTEVDLRLSPEPLLGRTLDRVTCDLLVEPGAPPTEEARPALKRSPKSRVDQPVSKADLTAPRPANRATVTKQDHSTRPQPPSAEKVMQLPKQMGSHQIKALVRGVESYETPLVNRTAVTDSPSPRTHLSSAPADRNKFLSGLATAGSHQSHAGRTVHPADAPAAGERRTTWSPRHGQPGSATGPHPWQAQLDGLRAPVSLLTAFIKIPAKETGRATLDDSRSSGNGGSTNRPRYEPIKTQAATVSVPAYQQSQAAHAGEPTNGAYREPGKADAGTNAASAVVLPPRLASLLPSLVTTAPVAPPARPAAAVAAAGLRVGAHSTEDDLPDADAMAALAARMKRILDEEARRHGIDV